jgi:hypothetical protein
LGCRTKHPQTWVQTEPPKLVENTGWTMVYGKLGFVF